MTQFRDPILHIGLMLRCSQTECKSELSWYSVSARCWDALTLQQRADLTCCDKLPHCQCSFCIPFFLLLYSECNKYWVCEKGFDGLCCSQFCFSFIFMKKTCILSYILCCCFDICNNVAGKWEILVWRLWANSIASSIEYNTWVSYLQLRIRWRWDDWRESGFSQSEPPPRSSD
jgi:hypothetical protein